MEFGAAYPPISQTHTRRPFQFALATWAILLAQARDVTHGTPYRNQFNIGDVVNDFKMHEPDFAVMEDNTISTLSADIRFNYDFSCA